MEQDIYGSDPFSSENLWRLSKFTLESLQPLEPLLWNEELPDLTGGFFKSPLKLFEQDDSTLHNLDIFGDNFFDTEQLLESTTDVSSESQINARTDRPGDTAEESESLWSPDLLYGAPDRKTPLRSWEGYQDRSFREPVSAYFSESGAKGFDAALAHSESDHVLGGSGRLVPNSIFFQALFRAGLGWSSMFFRFNEQMKRFEKVRNDIRVSGVSFPALNSLTEQMLQCGTNMQKMRMFVRNTPLKSNEPSALSTFSSATAVILYTLEKQLASRFTHIGSLIQIQALFQRCGELVGALANIVDSLDNTASEAQVISVVLGRAAYYSQKFGWIDRLFHEIVIRVTKPWLDYVEAWVGLRSETPTLIELATGNKSFVAISYPEENKKARLDPGMIDYRYCPQHMPSFIPADQAQLMFETGKSLRLLKRSHPRHPIASDEFLCNSDSPRLHCVGTWADIERIQSKAYEYEGKLRAEILKYNRGEASGGNTLVEPALQGSYQKEGNEIIAETFDVFDIDDGRRVTGLLANHASIEKDQLGHLVDEAEAKSRGLDLSSQEEGRFGPEFASTLYLSLAPLIASQGLLIDFSCLHLLFKEHKLRYHLTLQWRFQLLGDGFFTSRLSHSLFDPEMESGERRSGVVRSGVHTGLRLGSRDTWPPASSELRLVLIGLLGECHVADESLGGPDNIQLQREKELPGGLSFAIRELTSEEIVKCKDPNAIEALDFLRLQYKPPAVLEAIITPRSLNKYDHLFKHLLRLIRMVSAVKGLVRDSTARGSLSGDTRNVFQRFRIDSQHFVLAVSDYCFHVGVGSTWRRFQDTLSRIEDCLDRGDIDGTIEAAHSVTRLRDHHEDVLDQILFALFLSKRHIQAAKLLESIFATILTFAPLSRMDGMSGIRHESETTVFQLYTLFRKQTSAFVNYLRSLDGGKASSKSFGRTGATFASREEPTNVFENLLSRLDMKKYY
ncbi:hypothetical protein ASPWEDRAFT_154901 [Aspergillus wentii DTO 134E9]|uniref:Spindle pole body component n=1 Tax=Aspergillus wentii DTO 134E9 TaxID=1073089 RepID=A0A1L9RJY5_ASPWE|nr:uncharacterized protein ASPWEDRAFT_154901 [Aspergillus wentii DTO 134E9]KAI9923804.1 hypothetical protein MW887_008286 [Aspergillus wentii]OJJ35213.1 hypothetical protein ASPWEDRAFT_154901 [Aspergillus wentii DTO 134E9]